MSGISAKDYFRFKLFLGRRYGAENLLRAARDEMNNGRDREAFRLAATAKSLRKPVRDLDLLRGKLFLRMNRPLDAKQALLEELAHFADNDQARTVLQQTDSGESSRFSDDEFTGMLPAILPYTMVPQERLYSLYTLARKICENDVGGDFVECGVARGGTSALLASVIKRHSRRQRVLYSFDTFSGMPDPTAKDLRFGQAANDTGWGAGTCAAPVESLLEAAERLDVVGIIRPVSGDFRETLPAMRDAVAGIALLHIDVDWYASTKAVLENLYARITDGGVVQIDDYGYWDGCKKAVDEYREAMRLTFQITPIDGDGVWFVKIGAA
jgi:hypothetical protein